MSSAETDGGSSRITLLARPRQFTTLYREDKPSVYWSDYAPLKAGPDGFTISTATPRVQELSAKRRLHPLFHLPRSTPIWPVREASMHAEPSERTISLGKHRHVHPDYKMDRSTYMIVAPGAKQATASARVQTLATPKVREDQFCISETIWGQHLPVSEAAMHCPEKPYITRLAEAKPYHPLYYGARPVQWPVEERALKAIAPLRLQQLARPRSRTLIKNDYDPYLLTNAAKKAKPSARVEELSQPIPRKVKQKK